MVLTFIKSCQFLWWDSATQSLNILASPCFQHFSSYFFKISLCAEAHLETIQTSAELTIWRFSFRADFPRLFSVTLSEAAVRRCSVKKFAKFCKIHTKTPVSEVSFWYNFFELLKYKKVRTKHKFLNGYSATNRAHLYCKWTNFKFSLFHHPNI